MEDKKKLELSLKDEGDEGQTKQVVKALVHVASLDAPPGSDARDRLVVDHLGDGHTRWVRDLGGGASIYSEPVVQ